MTLPCPGPASISFLDIQNEFGGSNPIGLNEYYRNGGLVSSNNTSVPTSGSISLDNFFCAVNEIIVYITSNSENVNVQSLFGGNWTQNVPKRLVINPGVVVGSLDPGAYALIIPGEIVSTLRIDNNGSIQGAGGSPNSGNGGPAILANTAVTIDNIGSIYAGGGGGGQGGTGGGGRRFFNPPIFIITNGGAGGVGGVGQGYNQSNTTGAGGAAGGSGAGTGGTGGTGGTWGASGADGSVGENGNRVTAPALGVAGGPGYGGLGGYYIVGNSNVTWIATGTRLGAVG
jgi:hypothetical protein